MGYNKDKFMETQKVPRKLKKKLQKLSDTVGTPVVKKTGPHPGDVVGT